MVAKGERGGGGGGTGAAGELGVNRYKLLPLEWMGSESLLCSPGELCPVTYDGA